MYFFERLTAKLLDTVGTSYTEAGVQLMTPLLLFLVVGTVLTVLIVAVLRANERRKANRFITLPGHVVKKGFTPNFTAK